MYGPATAAMATTATTLSTATMIQRRLRVAIAHDGHRSWHPAEIRLHGSWRRHLWDDG